MPVTTETHPVEDSVPKVNDELAVGSDVEFQHRWESLENVIWIFLVIFLLLSLLGFFGRGPMANVKTNAPDGSMKVQYERFQRFSTPSVMTVQIAPAAIHNGKVELWVSEALVKPLGNQRVIPQPDKSQVGDGGVLYAFPVSQGQASIEFQTQPSKIGKTELKLRVPGYSELDLNIYVFP
jgi:hypothetical protein